MSALPNLSWGLVYFGGGMSLLCLILFIATLTSSRIQNDAYNVTQIQLVAFAGLLIFAVVATFGYSMPRPAERVLTLPEMRAAKFEYFYNRCVNAMGDSTSPHNRMNDCTFLARVQADGSLGIKSLTKVIRIPVEAPKTDLSDDRISLRKRTFDEYYDKCRNDLETAKRRGPNVIRYCTTVAQGQTRAVTQ